MQQLGLRKLCTDDIYSRAVDVNEKIENAYWEKAIEVGVESERSPR